MTNYELWNFTAFSGVDIVWHAKIRCSNCKVQPAVLFSSFLMISRNHTFDTFENRLRFDRSRWFLRSGDPWWSLGLSAAISSSLVSSPQRRCTSSADASDFFVQWLVVADWLTQLFLRITNHGWFLVGLGSTISRNQQIDDTVLQIIGFTRNMFLWYH